MLLEMGEGSERALLEAGNPPTFPENGESCILKDTRAHMVVISYGNTDMLFISFGLMLNDEARGRVMAKKGT